MKKLFKKLHSKHKKGFTLFEVLVVVVILGTLAVVAIPTYNKLIRKGRVADGLHILDMLADAQDKYFIEHGHYAENITSLKAPFKETRQADPSNPFTDIVTTNFTYTKNFRKNCIEANSNIGGNYTLVKNYKQRDKIVCRGADCANVEDYVDAIGEDAYGQLCPDENQCDKDQQWCANNQPGSHFFWMSCSCACNHNDYLACIQSGGTYNTDCTCSGILPPTPSCTTPCENEGETSSWGYTDTECHSNPVTGGDIGSNNATIKPTATRSSSGGKGSSSAPGSGEQAYIKCGVVRQRSVCTNGCWEIVRECVDKTELCSAMPHYVLNPGTCECEKTCDPNNKPDCPHQMAGAGYAICDPCPSNPSVIEQLASGVTQSAVAGGRGGKGGSSPKGTCYHCGYKTISDPQAVCVNGEWVCDANPSSQCNEVTGDFPSSEDCDGGFNAGNQCGEKKLVNVTCQQGGASPKGDPKSGGIPVLIPSYSNTCTLKDGNACFDGDTTTEGCPLGERRTCRGCQWDYCEPYNPCESSNHLPDLLASNSQCRKYKTKCEQNSEGIWAWVYDYNNTEWLQPGYECENDETTGEGCPPNRHKVCRDCKWGDCELINTHNSCEDAIKPADEILDPEGAECYRRVKKYTTCQLDANNNPEWAYTISWQPKIAQSNCDTGYNPNTPSHANLPHAPEDYICVVHNNHSCQMRSKCPNGSIVNIHDHKCYTPRNDFSVFVRPLYDRQGNWHYMENACVVVAFEHFWYSYGDDGKIRACQRQPNGHFVEYDEGHPCDSGYHGYYRCIGEEREVLPLQSLTGSALEHCGTTREPNKVAFNINSIPVGRRSDAFFCFWWMGYGCQQYNLGPGRTCDEVPALTN